MADDITIKTLNSGFFDSMDGDRVYSAEEMNSPYSALIGNGVFGNDGVPVNGTTETSYRSAGLQVSLVDSKTVGISVGGGIIRGHWFTLDTAARQSISPNYNLYTRWDLVIVKYSSSDRVVTLEYREGGDETDPEFDGNNEFAIGRVIVPSDTTGESASTQDLRATKYCPLICGLVGGITEDSLWSDLWGRGTELESLVEGEIEKADDYYSTDLSPYETLLKATGEVVPVSRLTDDDLKEIIK